MKSGDSIGGIANGVNTITGVVSGLSSNQGNEVKKVVKDQTKEDEKTASGNNDFYVSGQATLGFTKSDINVDEVHNDTKNMTLSGFNQEGGTVTGNIENLTIESKQNTSTTTKETDISRGLGSFVGDFGGMIAGGIAGEIAISKATNTFRGNLNTSTDINNYKEFPNNSSPINSNAVSLNQEFTTINGLGNNQFSNQAEVVKTVNVKNPLQDVSNIVDWKPVKKVDSSGEYLMNAINDNKTNYYLDYKVAGYYASDIRNMTLTKFSEVGVKGKVKGKNVRMLIGDAKDAYSFYRARVVEIYKSYPKGIELVNGVPVEQWLVEGVDKNGNKVVFRNFSTYGGGNIPTIDVYSTTGRFRGEIKFKE